MGFTWKLAQKQTFHWYHGNIININKYPGEGRNKERFENCKLSPVRNFSFRDHGTLKKITQRNLPQWKIYQIYSVVIATEPVRAHVVGENRRCWCVGAA